LLLILNELFPDNFSYIILFFIVQVFASMYIQPMLNFTKSICCYKETLDPSQQTFSRPCWKRIFSGHNNDNDNYNDLKKRKRELKDLNSDRHRLGDLLTQY
jgi:hypothetical protein